MAPEHPGCSVFSGRKLKLEQMRDAAPIDLVSDADSDVKGISAQVDRFLSADPSAVRHRVLECLTGVLHCQVKQLATGESLFESVGAESMDFMEILFRLQELFAIEIPVGAIREIVREGIEENFEVDDCLTDRAIQRLRIVMPEIPFDSIAPGLRSNDIPRLFTSDTFVRLVAWRLCQKVDQDAGD